MSATPALDVLVVDDEPALREVLSIRLQDWGYSVTTAEDASAADAALSRVRPDLVLSDVVLPGASGIELLRRLRRHDPTLPVILMTAHANVDSAVEAMKVGATDFLTKPIDSNALHALLRAADDERRQRWTGERLDAALAQEEMPGGLIGT